MKPTPHNRRQFDRLLQQLLGHQLVSTRINTKALPTLLPPPRLPLPELAAHHELKVPGEEKRYTISAYVNQAGVIRLLIDSPLRWRYKIELTDKYGELKYQEFNNLAHYRRWLDVSALGSGSYLLLVRIDGQDIRYELKNGQVTRHYQLESLAVNKR